VVQSKPNTCGCLSDNDDNVNILTVVRDSWLTLYVNVLLIGPPCMSLLEGVPEFKRRVGETERAFMRRVDCETLAVIQQSQFNDKYQRVSTMCISVSVCD